uniref:Uncharacterized protein n=1 Tax=Leishmania guyanensis TaxID=5670 RepID=A0A1E1IZ10_LEIGU|nr:Hypothetical protein BN36_2640640 [Leishmania guyanensis]
MNSTARAWLNLRRTEGRRLHDGTTAQVERLHLLTRGTARLAEVNRCTSLSLHCQLASPSTPARAADANAAVALLMNAQSAFHDEEREKRDLLSQEENNARISTLCCMLHCALRRRYPRETDGDAYSVADDRSSLSSMAPRMHVPTPFSSRDLPR